MSKFRYGNYARANKRDVLALSRPQPQGKEDEGLTGMVRGKPASDLEERLARSFSKYRKRFEFQVPITIANALPDEQKMLDFLVDGYIPIEPYGFIGHYFTGGQKAYDRVREQQLNDAFRKLGWRDLIVVKFDELQTQYDADDFVRRTLKDV